jgi:sRNA-binding regulator protein Hfq
VWWHRPLILVLKQPCLESERKHQNQKTVKIYLLEGIMLQLQQAGELSSFPQVILGLESRIQKRGYGIPLYDKVKQVGELF